MKVLVRQAIPDDAEAVSVLVQASFLLHVAPDWEPEGGEVFLKDSAPESLRSHIAAASFAAVALDSSGAVGFILLGKPDMVHMLFVATNKMRKGVGRALWESARTHVELHYPSTRTIELNASPYAVDAYKALGFYPISERFHRGGCVATRMACWLPGRSISKVANAMESDGGCREPEDVCPTRCSH